MPSALYKKVSHAMIRHASTHAEQPIPPAVRVSSVIMGKPGTLPILCRLIAMELYKLRRRVLSKALLVVGFGLIASVFLATAFSTWNALGQQATSYTPPLCSVQPGVAGCLHHPYPASQAERAQYKQSIILSTSASLRLPASLERFSLFEVYILPIMVMILVGTLVGEEYTLGTVRLMFTRGPKRLHFLSAKVGTALICLVLGFLALILFGILEGYLITALSGIAFVMPHLNSIILLQYALVGMAGWFVYAMMALFFGTMGRSTVAGIVGPLVWFSLEPIVGVMINKFAENMSGAFGNVVRSLPDYLVSSNIFALVQNTQHTLIGSPPASVSDIHAWSVLLVYTAWFIGLSCWFSVRRDITN